MTGKRGSHAPATPVRYRTIGRGSSRLGAGVFSVGAIGGDFAWCGDDQGQSHPSLEGDEGKLIAVAIEQLGYQRIER